MILEDVTAATRAQVIGALADMQFTPEEACERAETFIAIALHFRVPIEELTWWIHFRVPDKEWSAGELRAWCTKYRETVDGLTAVILKERGQTLCPTCQARPAQQIGEQWICALCGEVQP